MRIGIVGAGYVGLVSGACFAELGHDVTIVDVDPVRVAELTAGTIPIYEPGLDAIVVRNVERGKLAFTTDVARAASGVAVLFLAVGTPSRTDGRAELRYIFAAARQAIPVLDPGTVIVTKSTVPIGTGDDLARLANSLRPGVALPVASNPEFLREGVAIEDFMAPDRIVVGVEEDAAADVLRKVYAPLTDRGAPLLVMRRRTSELTKYAANSFLATKVGFINEMADLCEKVGADVTEVARGIGLDHRIGPKFLNAGPGFGGSCFPKDALALINTANDHGAQLPIIERVIHANEMRKRNIGRKVLAALGGGVRGRTVAVLGLAFKPDTDDMREAPSIDIVHSLDYWGATVRAYDPEAMEQARKVLPESVSYASDAYACAEGADAAVIVTEWAEFRALDLARLKAALRQPVLVDLRNVFDPAVARAAGFTYDSVGR